MTHHPEYITVSGALYIRQDLVTPPGGEFSAEFAAKFAAQGIEAGTDETLQAARPEGREPGGEAMRPDTPTHLQELRR